MVKNRLRKRYRTVALAVAALGVGALVPVLAARPAAGPQLPSKSISAADAKQYIGGQNYAFSVSIGHADDEWWLTYDEDADVEEFPMGTPPPGGPVEHVATIIVQKYPANSHCYWITVGGKPMKVCPED